ncbi:hypothetical protein [Coleofasciculus sp.]|uniref:hypothetical protein n=1 Tax=Coleofasciculus sp. TaxID=3100458 RepID=UPI003A37AB76
MGQTNQAVSSLNQALSIAKTIESISVVPERSLFWLLAQKYAIAGHQPKALETLSQARQIASTIENEQTRQQALAGIIQQQEGW